MRRARGVALVAAALIATALLGQNATCETAIPYPVSLPSCVTFPPQQFATVCWSFVSPTNGILLDAVSTSSCVTVQRQYILYDGECTPIDTSLSGYFFTFVGQQYTMCVELECIDGPGIQGVCLFEPLPLFARLVILTGTQRGNLVVVRFLASEWDNSFFAIHHSPDLIRWTEVGILPSTDNVSEGGVAAYEWSAKGMPGIHYFRVYDSHDVLLGTVAVPYFEQLEIWGEYDHLGRLVR